MLYAPSGYQQPEVWDFSAECIMRSIAIKTPSRGIFDPDQLSRMIPPEPFEHISTGGRRGSLESYDSYGCYAEKYWKECKRHS